MKRNLSFLLIPLFGGLFVLFSGCYTQLKTMREEPADNRDYNSSQMSEDTAYMANGDSAQGYCSDYDDGCCHSSVGFDYYYPSYGYGYAYGNPWVSDFYWGYNYYPWYCGTPYIGYGGFGYYGGYGYGGYGYGGYGYGRRGGYGTRTPVLGRVAGTSQIEASRGASVIGNRYNLPGAARIASSSARINTGTTSGRTASSVRSGSSRVSANRNATLRYYRPPNAASRSTSSNRGRSSSAGRSSDHGRAMSSAPHFSGGGGGYHGGGGGGGSRGGGGGHGGGRR